MLVPYTDSFYYSRRQSIAVPAGTVLPERASMLHMGTPVTRGAAEAVVVATGSDT